MKKITGLIIILLIASDISSQTELLLQPISLDSARVYEDSIGSISKGIHHFNPYGDDDFIEIYTKWPQVIYKPLIFERTNDEFFPTLHTWYFYDKDSTVKWIYYNWALANTVVEANDSTIIAQGKRLKEYENKYVEEKNNIIKIIGSEPKSDTTNNSSYINYTSIWDTPDQRIVLSMTVDKAVAKLDPTYNHHRIILPLSRIYIRILITEEH